MVVAKCETCGADLTPGTESCGVCAPPPAEQRDVDATETVRETSVTTDLPPDECTASPIWIRASAASVYSIVGLLCAAGSLSFFMEPHLVLSDIVFGTMAIGLAVISIFGVKESLFPSTWKPE